MAHKTSVPDRGWAWMILVSSFTIRVITTIYGTNVYFAVFQEHFGKSKSEIAWIFALSTSTSKFVGPISAILTQRYGYRPVVVCSGLISAVGLIASMFAKSIYHLYFTCGIITGIGYGLPNIPSLKMTADYFKEKRSFANSVMMLGLGVGKIISTVFCYFLVETFHWRGSLLIQAGVALHFVVCGVIARPFQASSTNKVTKRQTFQLFKDLRIYISALYFFFSCGFQIFVLFDFKILLEKGIDPKTATYIISIGGITNIASRLVLIAIEWFFKVKTLYIACFTCIIIGTLMICFALADSFISFAMICGLLGVFLGIKNTVMPDIALEVFDKEEYLMAMGYLQFSLGISFFIFPPVAGWLADKTGHIDAGLNFGGGMMFVGAALSVALMYFAKKKDEREIKAQIEMKNEVLIKENNNHNIPINAIQTAAV